MDPYSGFCSQTRTYHSLRPKILDLPPPSQPLSITEYVFSLLRRSSSSANSTISDSTFMINAATGHSLSYSDLLRQTNSLVISLKKHYSLSKGDVAFILSPHSLQIPILYFSLLSIGVIISPTNPDDSSSDITRQINLSKPVIVFTASRSSHKLINGASNLTTSRTVLIDSPEFLSLLTRYDDNKHDVINHRNDVVNQSDVAVFIYSSGTTGPKKGVQLTHRNLILRITANALAYHPTDHDHDLYSSQPRPTRPVSLTTRSLAGVFGLTVMMTAVSQEETLVLLETPELQKILEAVDKYKANYMPVSPSDIVALLKSDSTSKYDLSSLIFLCCGGAPLSKEVAERFRDKFPNVQILIRYGLTETGGETASTKGPVEVTRLDSVGRLSEFMEAKIVDPITGEALFPGQKGELWLCGPTIMKGYLGDDKATAETLDSEGWLKTGDLCNFDSQGFLFIVGRLKELIKYKAYQVPPAELEHLLLSNPEIVDAAVIPYPDEDVGQIPMAFVVRKLGSNITEAQVMEFTAKQGTSLSSSLLTPSKSPSSTFLDLLSIGVVVSPAIPDDSSSDITRKINLSKPVIVFTASQSSHKLINPTSNLVTRCTVLIDSPEFLSLLTRYDDNKYDVIKHGNDVVNQSDVAVIIYSSGTTGPGKAVQLTHRNLILRITANARAYLPTDDHHDLYYSQLRPTRPVSLTTRPLAAVFNSDDESCFAGGDSGFAEDT
ncbi:hypothetical protein LWI29_028447 [Acer saccharum]|uniref:AMP-dependent synthetase/ligase domain-containing protein n=1 Tax=Acer saccharum TaxID=4024 RepID=A0AA39SX22_ACESA|nr:hypothetical protein LWI29_028447 [Acer saccharum]